MYLPSHPKGKQNKHCRLEKFFLKYVGNFNLFFLAMQMLVQFQVSLFFYWTFILILAICLLKTGLLNITNFLIFRKIAN